MVSSLILALVPIAPLTHLGDLPVAQFMRRHWQRRPLLVRGALPGFTAPVQRATLFALARREDVESRLVTSFAGWRLKRGPIAAGGLPRPARAGWTLLVQGVDQHDDRSARLLARFRFVADARLDDLMVSYASDGGGVGPHTDAYDVFLLQAQGRRRWRIGDADPDDLVPGLPLAILRRFTPRREWILEPGDLLYLPPGVAHEGTAVGDDCITCSIGFRAPAWRDLVEPWLDTLSAALQPGGRYGDRGARPTRHPGRLPPTLVDATFAALAQRRPPRALAARVLLAYLSEPKSSVVFRHRRRRTAPADLMKLARSRGLHLDRRSRMLYSGPWVALNGEVFSPLAALLPALRDLADQREYSPREAQALPAPAWNILAKWHHAGWLHAGTDPMDD